MRDCRRIYVNGTWVVPEAGEVIDVINPATEAPVGRITLATPSDVDRAVDAARVAFKTFSQTTRQERVDLLNSILSVFVRRRRDLSDALVEELGAPMAFAHDSLSATGLRHLQTGIEALKTYVFEHPQGERTVVRREPIGVIGLITPWNWPVNQIMCKIVPALATGNSMVHKPSEVTPFSAHIIAEILHEAGVPKGVYNLVDGDGASVGAAISSHPSIDMVSFTGSTRAGIDVARRAAASVKRVHQELGGKCPNVVLDDADLDKAVKENVRRLMMNSGQTCHAPTRLLVPQDRVESATRIAVQSVRGLKVGAPTGDVDMGPVVSERQWTRIQSLIRQGIDEGATVAIGGEGRPEGLATGYYVRPTIFTNVRNDMVIAKEEIFGPVLCIFGYDGVDEAISMANDTIYGLAAYVQSSSDARVEEVAARLKAGMIYINGAGEDFEAPFGGYKMSGNGREWGVMAFNEFLETKALVHRATA
jgi:aldehyde dehydrogenase (NAD+)